MKSFNGNGGIVLGWITMMMMMPKAGVAFFVTPTTRLSLPSSLSIRRHVIEQQQHGRRTRVLLWASAGNGPKPDPMRAYQLRSPAQGFSIADETLPWQAPPVDDQDRGMKLTQQELLVPDHVMSSPAMVNPTRAYANNAPKAGFSIMDEALPYPSPQKQTITTTTTTTPPPPPPNASAASITPPSASVVAESATTVPPADTSAPAAAAAAASATPTTTTPPQTKASATTPDTDADAAFLSSMPKTRSDDYVPGYYTAWSAERAYHIRSSTPGFSVLDEALLPTKENEEEK